MKEEKVGQRTAIEKTLPFSAAGLVYAVYAKGGWGGQEGSDGKGRTPPWANS